MVSLEQEIIAYFRDRAIGFHQHVTDEQRFVRLDFGFGDHAARRYFSFDAKEKRQRYRAEHWPATGVPEEHLFILDDLAARKVLAFAPNSGLVIRDNTRSRSRSRYYLFTVVDLFLMPKVRMNRIIEKDVRQVKGKWLIDLRNGQAADGLADVFAAIDAYMTVRQAIFQNELACFGAYVGEAIGTGGITRRPEHWAQDVTETR